MTESWSASSYRRRPETSGRRSDPWITWGIPRKSRGRARRAGRSLGPFPRDLPPCRPRSSGTDASAADSILGGVLGFVRPARRRCAHAALAALRPADAGRLPAAARGQPVDPGAHGRRAPRRRGRRAPARRGRPRGRRRAGPRAGVARGLGAVGRAALRDPPRPVRDAAPRARGRQRLLRARVGLPQHRRPPHGRAAPRGPAGHPRRPDHGGRAPEHGLRDVDVPALGRGARDGGPRADGGHAPPHDQAARRGHLRRGRHARRDRDGGGRGRRRRRPARAPDDRPVRQRHPRPRPQRRLAAQAADPRRAGPAGPVDPGDLGRHHRPGHRGRQPRAQQRRACWSGSCWPSSSARARRWWSRASAATPWTCGRWWTRTRGPTTGARSPRSPTTTACRCSASRAAATPSGRTSRPPRRPRSRCSGTRWRAATSSTTAGTSSRGSPARWSSWPSATRSRPGSGPRWRRW